jgi:hypothetical protein
MVNAAVLGAQQTRRLVAVGNAELAPRAVAIGVDRGLGHAELAGDLLGAEVLVDEAQAFPFALRQQLYGLAHDVGSHRHASRQ